MTRQGLLLATGALAVAAGAVLGRIVLDEPAPVAAVDQDAVAVLRRVEPTSLGDSVAASFELPVVDKPVLPLQVPASGRARRGFRDELFDPSADALAGPVVLVVATLEDGRPAEQALSDMLSEEIKLRAVATAARPRTADLPAIGRYRRIGDAEHEALGEAALGKIVLEQPGPAWITLYLNDTILDQRQLDGGDGAVEFIVTRALLTSLMGSVRVRIVDSLTRTPIAGAQVTLGPAHDLRPTNTLRCSTDLSGEVEMARRLPGPLSLTVHAEGFLTGRQVVQVPSSGLLEAAEVLLDRRTVIEGRVVDHYGNPLPSIVTLYRVDEATRSEGRLSPESMISRQTSPHHDEGSFRFPGVPPAEYSVRVTPRTWEGPRPTAAPLVVDTRRGHVRDLYIPTEPGTRVTFTPAWPEGVTFDVHLLDMDGLPLTTPRELSGGTIREVWLLPGTYGIALSGATGTDDEALHSYRTIVVESEPLELLLDA